MTKEELIAGIRSKLVEVLTFIVETRADVEFNEPEKVNSMAKTDIYDVRGEYVAGELFGRIELMVSDTPAGAVPSRMKMSFGDEVPTPVSISSPNELFESVKNKHRLFVERSYNRSTAFALNDALSELEELECPPDVHEKIMNIIQKLR
jgi:hypothetical protein